MDIDMSATRQQMLETAERLNQQMTDLGDFGTGTYLCDRTG